MRTTIELSDFHRGALHQMSLKRGWRGYSKLLQEIIDFYFHHQEASQKDRVEALKLKGVFSNREVNEIRTQIGEVRKNWKE